MVNVVYDHQIFGFQEYGGVSRYFYELAKRVAVTEGFSASIVAPLHVNRYLSEGGANVKGFRVPVVGGAARWVSAANRCLVPILLRARRPALVHETYYQTDSMAAKGCPVVLTVYDMIHEKFRGNFGANDPTSERKRAAVARAARVICISEQTRRDLIELFKPDPDKVKTIHLGFSLTTAAEPQRYPELPRPFFLYVGKRDGHKNFAALLSAYASSASLRDGYDLIAFGPQAFTREEQEAVRAARIDSTRIRHLSGDDALLGCLYRRAAAFVYPSIYEGFGIPPLEAMNFGCPVLCSNTSSLPEIVGEAGLYFDPRDVGAIRQAMELLASSQDVRLRLISRGHDRVRHFSYDKCAEQTMDVYRDVLQ
jgi:glycosyltransferase involved in cell wall biosynthesis